MKIYAEIDFVLSYIFSYNGISLETGKSLLAPTRLFPVSTEGALGVVEAPRGDLGLEIILYCLLH